MKTNKKLINHVKKYTTFEWLIFIKKLESMSNENIFKLEQNESERRLLQNSNWYFIIIDLSIRFSDEKRRIVNFKNLPTKYDYRNFISLYLNSKDNESNFKEDLQTSLSIAISRYSHEQLKRYAPFINEISRLVDLYEEKNNLFKQFLGLTPHQIFTFVILNFTYHEIDKPFHFKDMYSLMKKCDSTVKAKKLELFLSIFSTTIKDYRLKCKNLGYSKDVIKNDRLIEKTPIIDLSNEYYFIPSINILLSSVTYKIFDKLCDSQVNIQGFKRSFGDTFENYTRRLTKYSHSKFFYECEKLIKEKNKEKAEYFILKDDSLLVVESKLLPVNENIILKGNVNELSNEFISTIKKAFSQLKSCFDKINAVNKYGIIVIHTHTMMLESYIELLKSRLEYDFSENILIISIIDFEILIHNDFETIIEYFQQPKNNDKVSLSLFFDKKNKYLDNVFDSSFEKIEKNLLNSNS